EVVRISENSADAAGKRVLGRDQARSRLTGIPARRPRVEHEAVHGIPAGVGVRSVDHLEASLARNAGEAVAGEQGQRIGDALEDDDVATIRCARHAGNLEEVDSRFSDAAAYPELLEKVPERGECEGVRRRRQAPRAEDAVDGVRSEEHT